MKICYRCRELKPFSCFGVDRGRKNGLHGYCRECVKIRGREQRARPGDVETRRQYQRRRRRYRFGLSEEKLLELQSLGCAICGAPNPNCQDHDHETDEFRGLLCDHCNRGLGQFRDSAELLEKAAAYLRGAVA